MDVNPVASLSTALAAARLGQGIDMAVLKKTLDAAKSIAAALIAGVATPAGPTLLPDPGDNINTSA